MFTDIENKLNDRAAILKGKFFGVVAAGVFLSWGAILCFIGGTAIIISQAVGYGSTYLDLGLLLGVACITVCAAVVRGMRAMPTHSKIMSCFDSRNNGGGLLVAMDEVDLGNWKDSITIPEVPSFKFDYGKKLIIFMLAVIFMLSGLLFPTLYKPATATHKMDISGETEQMKQQIEVLKVEAVITEEQRESLVQQLEKMERNATGEDPVKTWEALDHLRQSVMKTADMAAEQALKQMDNLAMVEKAAETLEKSKGSASPADLSQAAKGMKKMLQALEKGCPGLSEMLKKCNGGKELSASDMKKLAACCNMSQKQLKEMMNRLRKSGMLGKKRHGKRGISSQELQEFLDKNCPECKSGKCLRKICTRRGKPGVGRGRGDAPMIWEKRDLSYNGRFKEIALPPPDAEALSSSTLLGTTNSAPEADPSGKVSNGHLSGVKVQQADNHSFTIQPRHRKSVGNYFNRKPE